MQAVGGGGATNAALTYARNYANTEIERIKTEGFSQRTLLDVIQHGKKTQTAPHVPAHMKEANRRIANAAKKQLDEDYFNAWTNRYSKDSRYA